jgi:hypothetical protein
MYTVLLVTVLTVRIFGNIIVESDCGLLSAQLKYCQK